MVQYVFKGDVESVRPQQLDFISKVLQKKGFKGQDVFIEAVGAAGDNYIANVKRIVIKENGTTFKMIAKLAPDNLILREMARIEMLFHNEHVIYTEVLPKFRELQRSANVPKEEWFRFAECYGSNAEIPDEVILLEDLKEDNYLMLDRFQPLSAECVKIVLKNLAIYHSLSYVLKHKEPQTFDAYKLKFGDMTAAMDSREEIKMYFQQIEDGALAVLQDDKHKKVVKGSIGDLIHIAKKVSKHDANSKHSVIQQGDGWTNNILFKHENGTPVNCALIDYQMARESNPAYDIMYMLFNSTNHEQRKKHYYEFIDYYHSEMDKSLHNYGLKAAFVYPKDQLDADLKRYAKFMFASSIMVSTFVIRKTEDATKFKEVMLNPLEDTEEAIKAVTIEDKNTLTLLKNKIEGLADSFLEFGLLSQNK